MVMYTGTFPPSFTFFPFLLILLQLSQLLWVTHQSVFEDVEPSLPYSIEVHRTQNLGGKNNLL